MKRNAIRNALIAGAAALVLAFFAACGDLETFHGRIVGRDPFPWLNLSRGIPGVEVLERFGLEEGWFEQIRDAAGGGFQGWDIIHSEDGLRFRMLWVRRSPPNANTTFRVLDELFPGGEIQPDSDSDATVYFLLDGYHMRHLHERELDPNSPGTNHFPSETLVLLIFESSPWSPGAVVIPMEPVAPGIFRLGESLGTWNGDGGSDVSNLTEVTLTQGFYMGKYPVTREQWITVLTGNFNGIPVPHPAWSNAAPNAQENTTVGGVNENRRPATHVSWYDAIVFANWLSIARGLTPAYELSCASNNQWTTNPARWGAVPTSSDDRWNAARIAPGSDGYRLPTEAQWEFAAKGGVTADSYTFSGSDVPSDVAWTWENSESGGTRSPRMVGLLAANGLGIHDMSGNVFEWTQNWWTDLHPGGFEDDPVGADSGSLRVLRGGSWGNNESEVRSVYRGGSNPSSRLNGYGFRLLRPAP